jgi:hypothetical protein
MPAIDSAPVMQGGDLVTVYESTIGTALTDFTFQSEQETTFVFNKGVQRLTVIANSQTYHVKPNTSIRITDDISTLQIQSDFGSQPFRIEARAKNSVDASTLSRISAVESDLADIATLNNHSITYTYYPDGNVQTVTEKDVNNNVLKTVTYNYNALGDVSSSVTVMNGKTLTTTYNYDANGIITSTVYVIS